MDYTDINLYLDKAKNDISDAIKCSDTMKNLMADNGMYKTLMINLNHITEIIDNCKNISNEVTDTFEKLIE